MGLIGADGYRRRAREGLMRTYRTEGRAFKRANALLTQLGVWTSVIRVSDNCYRLSYDPEVYR